MADTPGDWLPHLLRMAEGPKKEAPAPGPEAILAWLQEQFPGREITTSGPSFYLSGERDSCVIVTPGSFGNGAQWWAGKAISDSGGLAGNVKIGDTNTHTIRMLQRFLNSGRRKILRRFTRRR